MRLPNLNMPAINRGNFVDIFRQSAKILGEVAHSAGFASDLTISNCPLLIKIFKIYESMIILNAQYAKKYYR